MGQRGFKIEGFTLVELMMVVAIIAVLVAIAVPQLQKFAMKSQRVGGQLLTGALRTAEESYYAGSDHYLTSAYFSGPEHFRTKETLEALGIPLLYQIHPATGLMESMTPTGWYVNLLRDASPDCFVGPNVLGCGYYTEVVFHYQNAFDQWMLNVNHNGISPTDGFPQNEPWLHLDAIRCLEHAYFGGDYFPIPLVNCF